MKLLIKIGVTLNILIGLGHLLCMASLDKVFAIYGIDGIMGNIAQHGAFLPCAITVVIALAFFVVALYGLSALKVIPRLPLQTTAITAIVIVFLGRAAAGTTMLITNFSWLEFSSSFTALLLALCYLPYLFGRSRRGVDTRHKPCK